MGTGPWPQPPTEAEQLQALMAAANGESYTSLSLSSFPTLHLLICNMSSSSSSQIQCMSDSCLFSFLFGWRATSQTFSLMKLFQYTLMFPWLSACSGCVLVNGQCPEEASDIIQAVDVATSSICVEFNNRTEMHVSTVHTYHMHIVLS